MGVEGVSESKKVKKKDVKSNRIMCVRCGYVKFE